MALLAGLVAVGVSAVAWGDANTTASAPDPVQINGEGAWAPFRQVVHWQDALSSAAAPIDFEYTETGSVAGREDFLKGTSDFVITGVPFTADELKQLPNGTKDLIDAPVEVTALAFLLDPPYPTGFTQLHVACDPSDPTLTPEQRKLCITKIPYTGSIKVPSANLAAMALKYPGTDSSGLPLLSWNHPDVLSAFGFPAADSLTTSPLAGPATVLRSDADETSYYLQQFAKTAAPNVWGAIQAVDPSIHWEPITEHYPRLTGASRQGAYEQTLTLGQNGADPASGSLTSFTAGILVPTPPSAMDQVIEAFPALKGTVQKVEMANANGDYVAPTTESIDAAVAAGGDQPLYALTNKVPNAYPLVWVEHLYVRSSGLSQLQTEALATSIRYLVTAGQAFAQPVGEGHLTPALVTQALKAADDLVTQNCSAKSEQIVKSTDPGPYFPKTDPAPAIGSMLHCQATPAASTTTATIPSLPSATVPLVGGSPFLLPNSGLGAAPLNSDLNGSAATGASSGAATRTVSGVLTTAKLPLPEPGGGGGLDRLTTLLLGAGAFLVVRAPTRRLIRGGSP